jgi:hypothetical protein
MRIYGIDEQTGAACEADAHGIMAAESCELDGSPALRVELGNGVTCLARLDEQPSPWLRLYLRRLAGIEEVDSDD